MTGNHYDAALTGIPAEAMVDHLSRRPGIRAWALATAKAMIASASPAERRSLFRHLLDDDTVLTALDMATQCELWEALRQRFQAAGLMAQVIPEGTQEGAPPVTLYLGHGELITQMGLIQWGMLALRQRVREMQGTSHDG